MSTKEQRQIGAALSKFWQGGDGPNEASIKATISVAGAVPSSSATNKQTLVLNTINESDDVLARELIEEFLSLLRESGTLELPYYQEHFDRLQRKIADTGNVFTADFHIDWTAQPSTAPGMASAFPPGTVIPSVAAPVQPTPLPVSVPLAGPVSANDGSMTLLESSPDLDMLCWSLRRLGLGAAARSVVTRRRGRPGIDISDEYDTQDLVELTLKVLFSDVRPEEPTASSAGSSSKMDFLIPVLSAGLELKVSKKSGDAKKIKTELLVDFKDYATHKHVEHLVAVVYDLADVIDNPEGFEKDLTGNYQGLDVRVLVVPWVGPRQGSLGDPTGASDE